MNEVLPSEKIKPSETEAQLEAVLDLGKRRAPLRRLRPVFALGLAAGAALLLYSLFGGGDAANGVRYITEPATKSDLTVTVTATGTVQPTNEVEISSELSGIVRRVLVDYNSSVTAGQTLAELDTQKLTSSVDSSRAKLQAAKAKVGEGEVKVTHVFFHL